jgi:hypothetical protein
VEFRDAIGSLSIQNLATTCDVVPSTISNWVAKKKFPPDARHLILKNLFENESFLLGNVRNDLAREYDDPLYFAFLNWLDVKETSQDNARARIIGSYRLWRFSVEHEGEFVSGRIDFSEDPKTKAVKVRMTQPKQRLDGYRATLETASGYLFRVSHMYLMLLTDDLTNDVRMTIFPRVKVDLIGDEVHPGTRDREKDPTTGEWKKLNPKCVFAGSNLHIVHMDGFGLGIDGSSGFFSPVHLALVDDVEELAALDGSLDVLPKDHPRVPDRVARKLERSGPMRRL